MRRLGAELRLIDGDHLGAVADPQFAPAIVEFVNRGRGGSPGSY